MFTTKSVEFSDNQLFDSNNNHALYGLLATSEETCVCNLQVASCFMLKEISTQQMFHISI